MGEIEQTGKKIQFVAPGWRDPRITVLVMNSIWIILGHEVLYFNRSVEQIVTSLILCSVLDVIITFATTRKLMVPLSGILTGLSLALLLESYDIRLFVVASIWSTASKYLIRTKGNHIFNPSNFGIVAALVLCHGIASVAPGSQWGGDFRYAAVIFTLGLFTMWRIKRLALILGWLSGYVVMGLLRMSLGQGGLIFALGPLTGAEFSLFTFVMIPDPKTTPSERNSQIWFGVTMGILDGFLRLAEVRYSMFYALFILTAIQPWIGIAVEKVSGLVLSNGLLRALGFSRSQTN